MSAISTTSSSDSSAKQEWSTFALRPNHGRDGKTIAILSNHFSIEYKSDVKVYHYDLAIEPIHNVHQMGDGLSLLTIDENDNYRPEESKKRYRKLNNKIYRLIVEEAVKQHSTENKIFRNITPIFDGLKNLYSAKEIPVKEFAISDTTSTNSSGSDDPMKYLARIFVDVVEDGRNVKYAVMLKLASVIDMNSLDMYFKGIIKYIPHDCLQVLNILLRHGPSLYKIPIGNSLYNVYSESQNLRINIGGGRQLAYGHFQSVRPLVSGVNLVVDRTCTALYDYQFIPRFIASILGLDRKQFESLKSFTDSQRARIKRELVGLQVQVKHLTYKRKYKVNDITSSSAADTRFEVRKTDPRGKQLSLGEKSVVEFFEDQYPNIKLNFKHLSCLVVGSQKNPNYLPIDVCELVPDQSVRKNLTTEQTATMIRESASQLPRQRLDIIKNSTKEIMNDSKSYLKEFGVEMVKKNEPIKIDGRVLEAPQLGYAMNKSLTPRDGKWDLKHNNCNFFEAAKLDYWLIMGFTENATKRFVDLEREIMSAGQRFGMSIAQPIKRVRIRSQVDDIKNAFSRAKLISDNKLQMIVFIIDPKIEYLYEIIKRIGDCEHSIITQCIKESNCFNIKMPLMNNLILKINTKLGGINAIIKDQKLLNRRTMFVGIDCSHPGVGDRITKSMSACVGSYDPYYVKYCAITQELKRAQEINNELREMVLQLLNVYSQRNNGILPEQIIIYRDGVSEGQFDAALKNEILLLIDSLKNFRPNYEPLITFIVVQKRHHTRFFPSNPMEGVGRANNVPPGLVIDTDVVSKTHFDYFLCSHEGIQGTSRPTHYYVLWDNNKYSADDLQKITYNLTHIFGRCNRSISGPAPVAYAHLAAYRAQRHIIGVKMRDDSDSQSNASGSHCSEPRRHQNLSYEQEIKINSSFQQKMYFC